MLLHHRLYLVRNLTYRYSPQVYENWEPLFMPDMMFLASLGRQKRNAHLGIRKPLSGIIEILDTIREFRRYF